MKSVIENLYKYIPPHNTGYEYIKYEKVYFPIKEVGIEVLERQTQQLNLLQETILKLVKFGVTDIDNAAKLLGLDYAVYQEIISQMYVADLLFVSDTSMSLTDAGKRALESLRKTDVVKSYLNSIFVNMITGEILDDSMMKIENRPLPSCMCLDQTFYLDIEFFRKNIERVNEKFEQRAKEGFDRKRVLLNSELYRLLSIDYEKTFFASKSCFVFVHPERRELSLVFEEDKNLQYLATAMAQLREQNSNAMKLFSKPELTQTVCGNLDKEKQNVLDKLIDLIAIRNKQRISTQEIEEKYYTSRYLLSGEVTEICSSCLEYNPKKIYIVSSSMKRMLESSEIVNAITFSSVENLVLIYNANEYGIDSSIQWIKQSIKRNTPVLKCIPQTVEPQIKGTRIIVDPGFVIRISNEFIATNTGRSNMIRKENADISFEKSEISKEIESITGQYML